MIEKVQRGAQVLPALKRLESIMCERQQPLFVPADLTKLFFPFLPLTITFVHLKNPIIHQNHELIVPDLTQIFDRNWVR